MTDGLIRFLKLLLSVKQAEYDGPPEKVPLCHQGSLGKSRWGLEASSPPKRPKAVHILILFRRLLQAGDRFLPPIYVYGEGQVAQPGESLA